MVRLNVAYPFSVPGVGICVDVHLEENTWESRFGDRIHTACIACPLLLH